MALYEAVMPLSAHVVEDESTEENLRRRARQEEERGRRAAERGDEASARAHFENALIMITIVAGMVVAAATAAGSVEFLQGGSGR